jgi:hypothetical protein
MSVSQAQRSIRDRFPPLWKVAETDGGFRVCDADGKWVTWIYCEDEEVRRSILNLPTRAEARTIASAVARLPEFMERAKL